MAEFDTLLADLELAEARVRSAADHVRRQRRVIAVLERSGHGLGLAREVLATFEDIEDGHILHRDRLAARLSGR